MAPRSAGPRPKRQPQRTCVACREVTGKRALLRIVRTPEGRVELDPTGKKSGRGAYLHADAACLERGLSGGTLTRALRAEITPEDRQRLQAGVREHISD